MAKAVGWKNIPAEMKARRQWCVSNHTHPEPRLRKAPRQPRGNTPLASVTNPNDWGTFEEAALFAWNQGPGDWSIGYVFSKDDPFCVIDLDVKDAKNAPDKPHVWTTPEQMEQYWEMAQEADTYVEKSLSGKSLHIFAKANIGEGCKKDGIEIYSQERYVIVTGDVLIDKPLREAQEMMEKTVRNLRSMSDDQSAVLVEIEEDEDDATIIERASSASNGDKFNALCRGQWKEQGYKSQSEADLALLSIFAFYTESNEQCRRLFRMTELGKREKAVKNNRYIDLTLGIIRGRQERARVIDISAILKSGQLIAKMYQQLPVSPTSQQVPLPPHLLPGALSPAPVGVPPVNGAHVPTAHVLQVPGTTPLGETSESIGNEIQWPPGQVGEIAKFVYNSAPRPVKEVAIVAALGFAAGVCGKAFMIPQSGLNIYLVLVGRSAIGKEAMHSGIAAILESLRSRNPAAMRFVDFSEFASGPALTKACIGNPSFVNVSGEWGRRMKRMAEDGGRDVAMSSLRTTMTNLYQKSGPSSVVGGINYSNKENNVLSVSGVAYSMIGETTPAAYYESLTDNMMEDGFMSRFTMVECTGDRPPMNQNPKLEPDKLLADYISQLCTYALPRAAGQLKAVLLPKELHAIEMINAFEEECDKKINATDEERTRQMWNRASLKAQRIAGLLAAVDNYINPCVTWEHVAWAIDLIRRDIHLMERKFASGEIGLSDDSREKKLMNVCRVYLKEKLPPSYKVDPRMKEQGIITKSYIQNRCQHSTAFSRHRLGTANAIEATIRMALDNGYLVEMEKVKLAEMFQFHGKAYRIVDMPDL